MNISVGIPTDGKPHISVAGDGTYILGNQLIGLGFHWQKSIRSRLPGAISPCHETPFSIINTLPLETYLLCVVGSEMNPDAPAEFLKAHAIISRSWAVGKILGNHRHTGSDSKIFSNNLIVDWQDDADHHSFDVCADDHCQRYQGLQDIPEASAQAVCDTAGLVLKDDSGNIVDARFSKCCGGRTELFSTCWQDEERPALESFTDPWCNLSSLSPSARRAVLHSILKDYDSSTLGGYRWSATVPKDLIRKNLSRRHNIDIGPVSSVMPLQRGSSGRIRLLRILGAKGHVDIGKELAIRKLLSTSCLFSSAFDIEDSGSSLVLSGRGWGHGVGLCQIGAARMALEGRSCNEILRFYYPGSSVSDM